MLIVLYLLAVVLVLFVAAVVATHDSAGLAEAPADRADVGLPDGVLQPEDLAEVRFGMVLRGYRMAEVDDTLSRVGAELTARDTRIRELEQALVDLVEPQVTVAEQARWTPPNTRSAPVVTSPALVTSDQFVVPEPQIVPVPSRMPQVVPPTDPPEGEPVVATIAEPLVATDEASAPDGPDPEAVAEFEEAEVESALESDTDTAPLLPAAEPRRFEGFDDLFPEIPAPEPAAVGSTEATEITDEDDDPSGEGRPEA